MKKQKRLSKKELIFDVLKDPDRKPLFRILYEFIYLLIIYRELPKHYFSRYLFKKEITNIKDYLPNKFLGRITPLFNDKKIKEVLDNKLYFDFFYRQFNISLPKILMYNHKKMFVLGGKNIVAETLKDFTVLLETIFEQNPLSDSLIIKKTYSSSSGSNIYKLYHQQIKEDPQRIIELYSEVTKSEFLFQETIKQHPDLNRLNPSSLNTIRIDTFINTDGSVDIMSAYIRMSTHDIHVDNISAGGCYVGINLKTGKLYKSGYSLLASRGVKVFREHPETKIVFENFAIPFFPQVMELVLKTASYMPGLRLVGWDVGIGESEPVLIEGNSDYEIRGNDFVAGGYLRNATFRKVLHEIGKL